MPISPLSLTAGAGLYQNQGIQVNAVFTTNRTTYESIEFIANLIYAINTASSLSVGASTMANLVSIGANVSGNYFPALGDSLPSNLSATVGNSGLITSIANTASTYTSTASKFIQIFSAAQGYVGITNNIINSTLNANNYLGPTFTTMDNLVTGDLAKVNLAFQTFGQDLQQLGNLINFSNYGTPASILQQISLFGNMLNGTTPALQTALLANGLTNNDIINLINNNVQDLFNPTGVSAVEFDMLQKKAYLAMCDIKNDDLQDILTILEITTPGINSLCDLLNPIKIFPNSWSSLTVNTPMGLMLIFNPDGTVNSAVSEMLANGSMTAMACDQLSKILPKDHSAANQALAISFSQVKNIGSLSLPQVAGAVA